MADLDDHIRRYSRRQLGLVTTDQLHARGASRKAIRHRVDRGDLAVLSPRLFRSRTVPVTDQQRALAGVLDAGQGAALSHDSAAALWGLPGFFLIPVEVSRSREGSRVATSLAHVHDLTRLPPEFVTELDGIPVVTPSFALLQLSGHRHPLRVARAMDTALALGVCTPRSLRRVLEVMARSGRNGIVDFRGIVSERDEQYRPPESGNESRLQWVLDRAGERRLRRQIDVGNDEEWLGRMDFADDGNPFVLQVDSERYHGALLDTERDLRQTEALEAAGYVVRHVWDTDLWHRPDLVVQRVREGRRLARARRHSQPRAS